MENHPILLSPPDIGEPELLAFQRVFRTGWFAPSGPELELFEAELAALCNRKYAVALASGTAALHLGLIAAGVKAGDFVLCSTLTFVATANAVAYVGATPIFVDSDLESGNISPEILRHSLEECARKGIQPAAMLIVDFLGKMANYTEILELSAAWNVPLVSDAAESLGSLLRGAPAGSFGQLAIFSFNGNKIATTSGGGMLVTDDRHLADNVRYLSTQAKVDAPFYVHEVLGYNYRLSNVLAAIGRAQVARLPDFIERRRSHRMAYSDFFSSVNGIEVFGGEGSEDNCWLTAILVDGSLPWKPSDLIGFLGARGIESRHLWKPMHSQPLYRANLAFTDGSADYVFQRGLALPSGSGMSDSERSRVIEAISDFLLRW